MKVHHAADELLLGVICPWISVLVRAYVNVCSLNACAGVCMSVCDYSRVVYHLPRVENLT